jgi:uncharacterized protein (TIGR00730 family)
MRVCVFCGSTSGVNPVFADAARVLGQALAQRQIDLVYGGGNVGLMGVVADAVIEQGGRAYGVIPHALVARELAHQRLTELHIVDSMHQRKALMADLADGFIALPGGFGTLEEFCEVVTWTQLGVQVKPCGLLNVAGFYDAFLSFIEHALAEQFMKDTHREIIVPDTDPLRLLDRLMAWRPPAVTRWITRGQE